MYPDWHANNHNPGGGNRHYGEGNPDCPICGGLGYYRLDLPEDHPDFGRLFNCECRTEDILRRLEVISGLGEADRLKRFGDLVTHLGGANLPHMTYAIALAREFVDSGDGWFTIYGGYGTAKTHLLMATVNEYRLAWRELAVFVRMADALAWVRRGYDETSPDNDAMARFERLMTVPFLAIDELERFSGTPWAEEQYTRLLERRNQDGLSWDKRCLTMIATNKTPDELGGWLASRMRDSRNILIEHEGPDMRPHMGERERVYV